MSAQLHLLHVDDKVSLTSSVLCAAHECELIERGFSTVLCLDSLPHGTFKHIKLRLIKIKDVGHVIIAAPMCIVLKCILKSKGQVLLYCTEKCQRASTGAVAYLSKKHKIHPNEALLMFHTLQPTLHPNRKFMQQLSDEFESSFRNKPKFTMRHELSSITPNLFITNFDRSQDVAELVARGITHVLNITRQSKPTHIQEAYRAASIIELQFPIEDEVQENIIEVLENVLSHIKPEHVVLCHCHAGVSRSVSIAIGILITFHNLSFDDAMDKVLQSRSIANPNEGFVAQLRSFSARLIC
jgi:predicted protein tyrosine phosphatase